jgi:hypothetical protein
MTERLSRLVLPGLAAILLFVVALGFGYVTESSGSNDTALPESTVSDGIRGSIQAINGNTLTLVTDSGPRQLTLRQDATVEAVRPASATAITPGDWVNAGVIPNAQTMFAIVGLTLIPPTVLQSR